MRIALTELDDELADIDAAASRFRADSEINAAVRSAGNEITVSPQLNILLAAALRVAASTDYLVDPTVAAAVIALGYDSDIAEVQSAGIAGLIRATAGATPAPGAWSIQHDVRTRRLLIPVGVGLDLGATAKALAADRAARRAALRSGSGVLVSIGGDVAVSGPSPVGGWRVAVGDDHRTALANPQSVVEIRSGGLATSSTVARRWQTSSGWRHHIVDPRTGRNPEPVLRTVTTAAASCLDANAATTASIIMGRLAADWLTKRSLPSRLVHIDGRVRELAGWPAPGADVSR